MSAPVIYFDLGNTLVYGTGSDKTPFADAVATIDELWTRGYQIGLLSDQLPGTTELDVRTKVDGYGLDSTKFDVITISSEFTPPINKPAAAIFDAARLKAGHGVASSSTVFVTEALSHINAARALGWRAIHKPFGASCTSASGECVTFLDEMLALFPPLDIDLHLLDATTDPGDDLFTGSNFWNSPDLWIRHADDAGSGHQSPRSGVDNFFNCRVRNRGEGIVRSYTVRFSVREYLGSQFVYPGDWSPTHASVAGSNLAPDDEQRLTARWDAADVPAAGTHACWLAAVQVDGDQPIGGAHVWEHNNLAQKNLAIVAAPVGGSGEIEFSIGNRLIDRHQLVEIEVIRPVAARGVTVSLTGHKGTRLDQLLDDAARVVDPPPAIVDSPTVRLLDHSRIEIIRGAEPPMRLELTAGSTLALGQPAGAPFAAEAPAVDRHPVRARLDYTRHPDRASIGDAPIPWRSAVASVVFAPSQSSSVRFGLDARRVAPIKLRFDVPADAEPGDELSIDVLQRDADGVVVGGLSLLVCVTKPRRTKPANAPKSTPKTKRRTASST